MQDLRASSDPKSSSKMWLNQGTGFGLLNHWRHPTAFRLHRPPAGFATGVPRVGLWFLVQAGLEWAPLMWHLCPHPQKIWGLMCSFYKPKPFPLCQGKPELLLVLLAFHWTDRLIFSILKNMGLSVYLEFLEWSLVKPSPFLHIGLTLLLLGFFLSPLQFLLLLWIGSFFPLNFLIEHYSSPDLSYLTTLLGCFVSSNGYLTWTSWIVYIDSAFFLSSLYTFFSPSLQWPGPSSLRHTSSDSWHCCLISSFRGLL